MSQPPFKPKMWNRMNKTNRHLVRQPWARAWLRGYVCDYSLMTSSDGLMLQWRHWAGPLATHQPKQSVTHGSLLLITEIQSRKHTKAQVHFATSSPHVSPESGSVSSGCRRRDKRHILCPLFAYERNLHGIFISWCLKSKAFERRVLQKAISHLCKGDTRARTKCSAAGNSVWGADRLFIDIWTLYKCKALFTNQRLRVHIRIYNSYSMRRYCHSGRRGEIKDRERVRLGDGRSSFIDIDDDDLRQASGIKSSHQSLLRSLQYSKWMLPSLGLTPHKSNAWNKTPQAQKNCLKLLLLSWWKSVSVQRQQKTAGSVLARL